MTDDHSSEQASVASAIANEERRLAELEREQEAVRERLTALRRASVAAPASGQEPQSSDLVQRGQVPQTSAEKVQLFRRLFRGRPDVYPTRFESKKTGKAGYAPACSNKFVRGLCELHPEFYKKQSMRALDGGDPTP